MSDAPWRSELSFTERLDAIMKITQACKSAFSNIDTVEVPNKAREVEERLFTNSWSKENYFQSWQAWCESALSTPQKVKGDALDPPMSLNDISEPSRAQNIGPYQSPVFHRSGLFSEVYKALDHTMNIFVALKVTLPSRMSLPHNSEREARILNRAKSSHIIPLLSSFKQSGDQFNLVFPFMPYTLEEVLDQGMVQPEDITSHLKDLFSALSHIHSLKIIHRDVKPSNILLSSLSGPACLADFGIAWMSGDAASEPTHKKITDVGTTCYRPPELLFGFTEYNCSLDLWAAGCVVAEVLLGGKKTLFDAGPLGSELALIQSIFKALGTPTSNTWPESTTFPDWGKMEFYSYPPQPWEDLLPGASATACDLLDKLVKYQSTERLDAAKVLAHPFLRESQQAGCQQSVGLSVRSTKVDS